MKEYIKIAKIDETIIVCGLNRGRDRQIGIQFRIVTAGEGPHSVPYTFDHCFLFN
jgi:hypothetical protein